MRERLAVFLGYQNVHLAEHILFAAYGARPETTLVHPLQVAQTAAWQHDPRVNVRRRDLNYRGWPDHPPRQKGVDVALAVSLIESAMLNEYDAAVVFTGDTDLLPAVEMAFRRTQPRVEVASWVGAKPLWFPEGLAEEPKRYLPYCHFLDEADFEAVRDRTDYVAGRYRRRRAAAR